MGAGVGLRTQYLPPPPPPPPPPRLLITAPSRPVMKYTLYTNGEIHLSFSIAALLGNFKYLYDYRHSFDTFMLSISKWQQILAPS